MSEPRVFVFVHPAYTDQICYPQTLNVWESFERCGATVLYGEAFRQHAHPQPGDIMVAYGRVDEYKDVRDRFEPHNRWHYVVDESNSSTKPYDKALGYMRMIGIPNIIVTYQNADHLQKLTDHGVKYIIMPQTFPVIRPKVAKSVGVLLSGQVSDGFYPVRTRAWRALSSGLRQYAKTIDTPGQDISTRRHDTIRERYYNLLDTCRMGIVCRAGNRDRFVAKYIEMGACHCLPVGDCPTYMPDEMKQAMVNIEGMDGPTICETVRHLLEDVPAELEARTVAFTAGVEKHYMATPNMQRVMSELRQNSSV